ncbi:endonuclease/exonuclease/phosphatase family protein [Mariniblastus fucicola]|uniref:Endonuclease/Exonuclease/phosphatase family protein n=1 Tax=Mariniblastus fucicola TaxID=980251 RepID=A0A5B9PLP1_9BACT|nr:endonuclease/exonuclease/phosphatase family protein [Mariniblastus fucicola]QEG23591.1 Endonuclease/Exonuclease/phosphatase family protein [Mariniblastus fucicola]
MKNVLKKRKLFLAVLLLLAIVLLPYLWSRINSRANRVLVFEMDEPGVAVAVEPSSKLRVACYNIAHGRGLAESNWEGGDAQTRMARLDEIADLLVELDADVVVLNEVDFYASWSNRVNLAEYLAEKAGYRYRVEERNLDFRVLLWTWRFGNAILSRYPISNPQVIDLPSYSKVETLLAGKKRGAHCEVAFGASIYRIVGLHLSHRSEEIRERSAGQVSELIADLPQACIVMGDMNSTPPGLPRSATTSEGANTIMTLTENGHLTRNIPNNPPGEAELTFRSDSPEMIIDWILVSESLEFQSYRVVDSLLSDHRPILAEIVTFNGSEPEELLKTGG